MVEKRTLSPLLLLEESKKRAKKNSNDDDDFVVAAFKGGDDTKNTEEENNDPSEEETKKENGNENNTPTIATQTKEEEEEEEEEDEEEAILGTDVKGEKSERISPVVVGGCGAPREDEDEEEEKTNDEERAAREANKEATTTTSDEEKEEKKMSVLELHFGKRKPNPPKELKYDQKPKEADPNAEPLPEELQEWKEFAEQQLADLVNLMKKKLIDCFHVRIGLSVMMIACPAKELREVLKDLRDMKVVGNTMRPYLIYLREILDGCGEKYRDKLDADMEFSSSDEEESSSSDDDESGDDGDDSDSEEIPEITRGNGPLAKTAKVRHATKIQGCSSSSEESDDDVDEDDDDDDDDDSSEEEEEDVKKPPKYDRQRCQLFSKFLGRFMIENRVQEQVEAARLLQADGCREFSNDECVQFLDLLQRQGKIMIDGPNIHVI